MTAKEMFEELGYELLTNGGGVIEYRKKKGYFYYVLFKKHSKTFYKVKDVRYKEVVSSITIQELKAINKQIEELGWDND